MKKNLLFLVAAIFVLGFVSSCGGNMDSKVKELAEKKCECKKIENDEEAQKCYEELEKKEVELEKEIKDLDEKEQERLEDLYKETYKACKK